MRQSWAFVGLHVRSSAEIGVRERVLLYQAADNVVTGENNVGRGGVEHAIEREGSPELGEGAARYSEKEKEKEKGGLGWKRGRLPVLVVCVALQIFQQVPTSGNDEASRCYQLSLPRLITQRRTRIAVRCPRSRKIQRNQTQGTEI